MELVCSVIGLGMAIAAVLDGLGRFMAWKAPIMRRRLESRASEPRGVILAAPAALRHRLP